MLPLVFLRLSSASTAWIALVPLLLSLLGLALTKRGWATAATCITSLVQTMVIVPALTKSMEQLALQLSRWLIYKLLLTFVKLLLTAKLPPAITAECRPEMEPLT